jgi:dihydrofolate reductase
MTSGPMSGDDPPARGLTLVAAVERDGGLGRDGDLPWTVPADLRHFERFTRATQAPGARNAVIMGRATWDSIPARYQPLRGRLNIVLSRAPALSLPEGALHARDLDAAIGLARDARVERIFVVGGAQIYALALAHPACREAVLTRIDGSFACDTFMPPLPDEFRPVEELGSGESGGVGYRIERWVRGERG